MVLQKEIREKAQEWRVPPDTVDKDYVLGHFLSVFVAHYKDALVFKGGTCLRKCYIKNYRFSEDLDFTAVNKGFVLQQKTVEAIAKTVAERTGIQFAVDKIEPLVFRDAPKGFQVYINYWGANHSKNQRPLPSNRWRTKIKLEVSTDEVLLLDTPILDIIHPYSDSLTGATETVCYSINEIMSEKLRALKQRSYTAPRDFYDLFHLGKLLTEKDWETIVPVFVKKMEFKNLPYKSHQDLIDDDKIKNVTRAWKTSIAHQINPEYETDTIIASVVQLIKTHLPNGQ